MMVKDIIPARFPIDRPLDQDTGSWWVMHIKPNCEKKVAAYLLSRNISYYFPLYKKKTRNGFFRTPRLTEVPLFRGYICFALDKDEHRALYNTSKFVRIIRVPDQERFVKELLSVARAIESGTELLVRPGMAVGKRVIIKSGPLEGTEGVVVRGQGRRVALSVEMFNQSVLVKLDDLDSLEPL